MVSERLKLLIAVIDLRWGTGTFLRNLLKGFKRWHQGEFEITLLVFNEGGMQPGDRELVDHLHVLNADVHLDWRRFHETMQHAIKVHRAVSPMQTDLIFTVGNYMNLLVPFVAPDRKIILSMHAPLSPQVVDQHYPIIVRNLARWRYPDRLVVVPSEGLARHLRRDLGLQDVRVIMHGVDADEARTSAAASVKDLPEKSFIVACGRITAQKDYGTAIRAFAEARQNGIKEDLLIIGDGEESPRMKELTRQLGLDGSVHFLGYRENPMPYMKNAKFLLLSSRWEGYALVLLEAMALGTPCISTDCPSGPAEILGDGRYGMLVPMRDPSSLSAAMVKMLGSQSLHDSMVQQAHQRAHELSLERMVREYRDLFRNSAAARQ